MRAKLFLVLLFSVSFLQSTILNSKNFSSSKEIDILNKFDDTPSYPNFRILPGSNIQVQTSVATHPSNPDIMAVSAITDVYTGGYTTGAYVSLNGGASWEGSNAIRDNQNNIITTIGDPSIVIDKNGTIVISYTSIPNGSSEYKAGISFSTNNGLHWSPSVYPPGVGRCDKITSAADNFPMSPQYGKIYIVYSDFQSSGIYFSSSSNGGISWDSAKRISPPFNDARVGTSIALGKYGEIYVSWPFLDVPTQKSYIGFAKSTNGGANWISNDYAIPVWITSLSFRLFLNGCRLNGLPSLSVDNSGGVRDGTIYITCTEKAALGSPATDNYDILIRSSSDQGMSWSSSYKVNQDSTGSLKYQFFPVLNVDSHGGVNVLYYDSRNTSNNDSFEVYIARSVNGGIHFEDFLISANKFKLTPVSPALFGIPGYIGSYIDITSSKNTITPVWFDNSSQIYQAWSSKIEFGAEIKIIPQGFYDPVTEMLRINDTVKAYLRDSYSPYSIIDSASGILDSASFTSEMFFTNAKSGNYYLNVKHRNSMEVWSSVDLNYSTGKRLIYDFTTSQSQTYGGNSVMSDDKWCIYSGDVNTDGSIDMDDTGIIYNGVSNFINGYSRSDVNGDGSVDLNDLNIAFNNSVNFIRVIKP